MIGARRPLYPYAEPQQSLRMEPMHCPWVVHPGGARGQDPRLGTHPGPLSLERNFAEESTYPLLIYPHAFGDVSPAGGDFQP
jgi:hypothetical protein